MANEIILTKELIGIEDILIGTGQINQVRGGVLVPITKVNINLLSEGAIITTLLNTLLKGTLTVQGAFASLGITDNAAATALTIAADGKVTLSGAFASLGITDNAAATALTINANKDMQFVGTAQFAAGEGIVFNGDAITAANTLDDYEEGSWTPVLSDGTNDAVSHANAYGSYEKIGRQVTLKTFVRTTSLGAVTGDIRVTGLPFAASSDTGSHSSAMIGYGLKLNITSGNSVCAYVSSGGSHMNLSLWDDVAGTTAMQATEWSDDGEVVLTAIYYV